MGELEVFLEFLLTLWLICKEICLSIVFTFISPPEKSVKGDIVLITGAGSGLGRLMSLEFAKNGAVVVAWDVNNKGNDETAQAVRKLGGTIFTYSVDVSNRNAIEKVAEQVKEEVGEVSILINNAGIVSGKAILDLTEDQIMRTFQVNVLSHFWAVQLFLPSMLERNHGHIVSIASMLGVGGLAKVAAYSASKAGVMRFMESLTEELEMTGKTGVHATCISPYMTNTGLFAGAKIRDAKHILSNELVLTYLHLTFWQTTRCFLPSMMSRNHGHIVTIASIAGVIAANKMGDYCASKFGAVGFAETLELELVASGKHGLHATVVCPYYINTGMFDGLQNRFPKLFPTLEPKYVVERIMHAVLTNQKQIFIPRTMYLMATLKTLLPVKAVEVLHKFLGASNMMDTFTGRQKQN